ncbi:MAG: hypothetical protein R3C19_26420 [Planctomycetaceae bacterium]
MAAGFPAEWHEVDAEDSDGLVAGAEAVVVQEAGGDEFHDLGWAEIEFFGGFDDGQHSQAVAERGVVVHGRELRRGNGMNFQTVHARGGRSVAEEEISRCDRRVKTAE